MNNTVISVENLTKQYDLGVVGTGSLARDLERWWAKVRRKPDPYAIVGKDGAHQAYSGSILALDDVSFNVQQGEALGIIGRNGAGKSTLLKILSRVTAPTSGKVKVKGRIGSLLEVGTGFHGELTGRENVYLNGAILGMKKEEVARKFDEIVAFSGVERFIDTPVKRYSSGMYVRLGFAVAAHLDPEILIIDEVLAVGDADFQKKCLGKMGEVTRDGRTILFVSHHMASVENLCNRSILFQNGSIVKSGNTKQVIHDYLNFSRSNSSNQVDLENLVERSGTGIVKLIDFYIEDEFGNHLETLKSGMKVIFVFKYKRNLSGNKEVKNVDFGFSIHKESDDQTLSVLYSSYQASEFDLFSETGEVRCEINSFPFSPGNYRIGVRILVDHVESDWPRIPIIQFTVIEGDFYDTGKIGFGSPAPILIKGKWVSSDTFN